MATNRRRRRTMIEDISGGVFGILAEVGVVVVLGLAGFIIAVIAAWIL